MLLNDNRVIKYIETLRKLKQTFIVEYTGNTITIDYRNEKRKFIESYFNKNVFAAYSKIKNDVNNSSKIHEIIKHDKKDNIWYNNRGYIPEGFNEIVIHIDLRSAYIRSLFNNGIISKETFLYTNGLKKIDRLISLGLFAKNCEIHTYDRGNLLSIDSVEQPLENVFYYSAFHVDMIMEELKQLLGEFYIFFWFDGIYAIPHSNVEMISSKFLLKSNYDFKVELLKDFYVVKEFPNIHFKFKQWEQTKNDWDDKNFSFQDKNIKKIVQMRIQAVLQAETPDEIDYYKEKYLKYEQYIKSNAELKFNLW